MRNPVDRHQGPVGDAPTTRARALSAADLATLAHLGRLLDSGLSMLDAIAALLKHEGSLADPRDTEREGNVSDPEPFQSAGTSPPIPCHSK